MPGEITGEIAEGAAVVAAENPRITALFDVIVGMDGFSRLRTVEQQLEVLNLVENFAPQSGAMSNSKGNRSMSVWFDTDLGSTIPTSEHARLLQMEADALDAIERAIQHRLQ